VTAQKPAANSKLPRGSKVRINVSTGAGTGGGGTTTSAGTTTTTTTTTTTAPRQVTVPNVVGQQQAAAQKRLNKAGLGVRVNYVASQKPEGQVVDQSPAAGTSVKKGSKVRIAVSLGPGATTAPVPDVIGQDQQTATNTLQNAGFQVQVIMVAPTDPSQSGTVVDEQPSGGTRAPTGSTVTIYVASG
jgi:serine/threonine-protein kinase